MTVETGSEGTHGAPVERRGTSPASHMEPPAAL